jgi:hypothetical protein
MKTTIPKRIKISKYKNLVNDIDLIVKIFETLKSEITKIEYQTSVNTGNDYLVYPNVTLKSKSLFGFNSKEYALENNSKETFEYIVNKLIDTSVNYGSLIFSCKRLEIDFTIFSDKRSITDITIDSKLPYTELMKIYTQLDLKDDIKSIDISLTDNNDVEYGSQKISNREIYKYSNELVRFIAYDLFGFHFENISQYHFNQYEYVYLDRTKYQETKNINDVRKIYLNPFINPNLDEVIPSDLITSRLGDGYMITLTNNPEGENASQEILVNFVRIFESLKANLNQEALKLIHDLGRESILNLDFSDLVKNVEKY